MANHDWMALVASSGLLVSEPILREHFPDGPPPVAGWLWRRLGTEWERFQLRPSEGQARWLNVVLEELTGIGRERWRKHPDIPEQTTHALAEYAQILRPSRVLVDDAGAPLLLAWVAPPGQGLDTRESETGRWRASPATKLERLMRAVEVPLGLVTNGREFRLIHAEGPSTSHITWDAPTWLDEPRTLDAFAMLLSAERFFGPEDARLLALVQASQERQADVTDQLGEQVRTALDQFVRAVGRSDQTAEGAILAGMPADAIYEMALVFLMRLVFLLYGEENHLLPHGEVLYDNSYGLTHLWTRLEREHHEDAPAMARRFDAFGQLLATFRLIHAGCTHPDLALRGYGGHMFDPERFPALEHPRLRISNATVHSLLRGLIFARGKVGRTVVNQRLSYRELDVEQLGSVYEGLIDGMVRRAEEVMVTIDAGDQPVVALRELEAREGADLATFLRSVSSMSAQKAERVTAEAGTLPLDQIDGAEWLDAETLAQVAPYAEFLDVGATVLPGDLYVVQQSGARKAGGQYYTPRWITRFICERTLEPLVYEGEGDERRVKPPAEILALNVCDPAMGSGAFLVQACRYLAEQLVASWDLCAAEHPGERITIPEGRPQAQAPRARPLPEDHDEALIWARRYVADNCLYGVDVNPLAVEIAKMSLWLATLSQDRPFTFLDHKFKCGNSIIGAWASDIDRYPAAAWDRKSESGSPLAEALKQIRKQVREQLKAVERDRRAGQLSLSAQVPNVRAEAAAAMLDIEEVDTLEPDEKERLYRELQANPRWRAVRRMYDAWCALWFWPLASPPAALRPGEGSKPASPPAPLRPGEGSNGTTTGAVPPSGTEGGAGGRPASDLPLVWAWRELMQSLAPGAQAPMLTTATPERIARWERTIDDLRDEIRFFHWELEFPDVFHERGGFDAIVMNPPWERIKLQENEFFATRDPEIAGAPNAAARRRLIARLPETNPGLFAEFQREKALADNTGGFLREAGHFPLTAVGDVNLYPLFAELGRRLINPRGGWGAVLPLGIVTDYYARDFFGTVVGGQTLQAVLGFENEARIFPGVHHAMRFCVMNGVGAARQVNEADFAYFCRYFADAGQDWRHFPLSRDDIAMLNPNTSTCPVFRSQRDAELTKAIYRRHRVLVRELCDEHGEVVHEENPWGTRFLRMIDMANDSSLFATREELEAGGFGLRQPGNHFVCGGTVFLPLYEGKMFWHYDHRFGTYEGATQAEINLGSLPMVTADGDPSPMASVLPRYWVAEAEQRARMPEDWTCDWLLVFRDITANTNERTFVGACVPRVAVGHTAPVLIPTNANACTSAGLLAGLTSFAFDYVARQKTSGRMTYFIVKQLPVIPPSRYEEEFCGERLAEVVAGRVLELVYTAWDIRAFARDLGDEGPPFVWDEERRAQLRAQLDAIYFHLYGIARADVDYIMSTFPIVERKDRAAHGCYRTRDLILAYYDAYASGAPSALATWLGPEEKREARRHPSPGPSPFRGGEQI